MHRGFTYQAYNQDHSLSMKHREEIPPCLQICLSSQHYTWKLIVTHVNRGNAISDQIYKLPLEIDPTGKPSSYSVLSDKSDESAAHTKDNEIRVLGFDAALT